jgi:hypothetical protein
VLDRKLTIAALGLSTWLLACSKSEPSAPAAEGSASSAAISSAGAAQPAPAATGGNPGTVVSGNGEARVLGGTGIRLALPPGTERVGRELLFRIPGQGGNGTIWVRLDRRVRTVDEPAVDAAERVASFLVMSNEFVAKEPAKDEAAKDGPAKDVAAKGAPAKGEATKGEPAKAEAADISEVPDLAALWGTTPANVLGDAPEQPGVVVASRAVEGSRVFLRASFPEAERSRVEQIAKSLDIEDAAKIDALAVHGIELGPLPSGYELAVGQLAPLWVFPPDQAQPFVGATFELRAFGPGQLDAQIDSALKTLRGERSSCTTEAANAEGVVKLTGAAAPGAKAPTGAQPASATQAGGAGAQRLSCKFEAPRGEDSKADIRLEGFQDAQGAVIAVTLVPQDQPEHAAAFDQIVQSIRLKAPTEL